MTEQPVVVDFPTIMDGYVVRWYASEHAANHHEPIISASRERVSVHQSGPLADQLHDQASKVHEQIRDYYGAGRSGKTWNGILTHRARLFGDVEPIEKETRA